MIKKLSELTEDQKLQFITLIADNFFYMLDPKGKYTDRLKAIFADAFLEDYSYACIDGDKVVGIVSCSNNEHTAVQFSKQVCIEQLGSMLGKLNYNIFVKYFGIPKAKKEDEGYIDFLCVHKDYRRKGIASKLLEFVYEHTEFSSYVLEVLGKNTKAIKFYDHLGFKEVERKKGLMMWLSIRDHTRLMKFVP